MTNDFCNLIIDKLLNVIGLSIINDYLYDEDKGGFVIYNEGRIKINRNGIFHNSDSEFNPLFDIKQMQYLFTAYIVKEEEDNGLYVQSTGINSKFVNIQTAGVSPAKYSIHIDTSEGSIDTGYYYNIALSYIEAIFRIANIFEWDINIRDWLRSTDYTDADMITKLENGKKGRLK